MTRACATSENPIGRRKSRRVGLESAEKHTSPQEREELEALTGRAFWWGKGSTSFSLVFDSRIPDDCSPRRTKILPTPNSAKTPEIKTYYLRNKSDT